MELLTPFQRCYRLSSSPAFLKQVGSQQTTTSLLNVAEISQKVLAGKGSLTQVLRPYCFRNLGEKHYIRGCIQGFSAWILLLTLNMQKWEKRSWSAFKLRLERVESSEVRTAFEVLLLVWFASLAIQSINEDNNRARRRTPADTKIWARCSYPAVADIQLLRPPESNWNPDLNDQHTPFVWSTDIIVPWSSTCLFQVQQTASALSRWSMSQFTIH